MPLQKSDYSHRQPKKVLVDSHNTSEVAFHLFQQKFLGFDTETEGLLERHRIFCATVCDGETVYFIPKQFLKDTMTAAFNSRGHVWFIQSATFDMGMLDKESLRIMGTVHCTKAGERIIQNNLMPNQYSLASMAQRRGMAKDERAMEYMLEHGLYTDVFVHGKGKPIRELHFDKIPEEIMFDYATQDAWLHYVIGIEQWKSIHILGREPTKPCSILETYLNEIDLTKTCFRMERRGIKCDKAYIEMALDNEFKKLDQEKAKFITITGEQYKDSNKHFATIFDKMGLSYPMTEKGNPSFNKDALDDVDNPVANVIKSIRRHEKYINTYYSSFLYMMDKENVLRASIDRSGTETGRFSYRSPNLQNVPKEDSDGFEYYVRKSFIPREGHCFVSIDYKQVEYRVMLDYAGEKKIIEKVNEGMDIHDATADLLRITRKQAKTVNFAVLYGTGGEKLAKMLNISIAEAYDIKRNYFDKLPYVAIWIKQVQERAKIRGYVTNWLGRRCHLKDKEFSYIIPNHIIQGSCGDIAKKAMVEIHKQVGIIPVLNVHDELLFELPEIGFEHIPKITEIMCSVYRPFNGMKIDCSVSHSWKSWGYCDLVEGVPKCDML